MEQYYKIIGKNFGHFPYKLGLNSLEDTHEQFDDSPTCVPGGLYFTNMKHICEFLDFGDKLCVISLPKDARVVQVNDHKWKADKIVIESMRDLWTIEIFQTFNNNGSLTHQMINESLINAAQNGSGDLFLYLIKQVDGRLSEARIVQAAVAGGCLEIAKEIFERRSFDRYPELINIAVSYSQFKMIKYLLETFPDDDWDVRYAFYVAPDQPDIQKYLQLRSTRDVK